MLHACNQQPAIFKKATPRGVAWKRQDSLFDYHRREFGLGHRLTVNFAFALKDKDIAAGTDFFNVHFQLVAGFNRFAEFDAVN